MNCPDFETLMLYLDDELGDDQRRDVSNHLISCSRCRDMIDSQKRLEVSWRDCFVMPDDQKFRTLEWNIFSRINRRWQWKTLIPAAAGIAAVFLGVKLILSDQPSIGRLTGSLETSRTEFMEETIQSDEEYRDHVLSASDSSDGETSMGNLPIQTIESDVSYSDADVVSSSRVEEGTPDECAVISQQSAPVGETGWDSSLDRTESEEETASVIIGGALAGSGSGGSTGGYGGIEEEGEESEFAAEIEFVGVSEECLPEEAVDTVSELSFSPDDNYPDSGAGDVLPSMSSIGGEPGDNRSAESSGYCRLHDVSLNDSDTFMEKTCVELVFNFEGYPDSCTAILLDSLFAGWSDYIPFRFRDTVMVIPLADVQRLFIDESPVPAETME